MAQTKTKRTKSSGGSKSKSSSSRPKSSGTKSKARKSPSKSRNGSSRSNGSSGKNAAREAVGNATKGVGNATSKAKIPLLAGGAALAGMAGGAALSAGRGRKVMGVRMPQGKRVKIRSKDLRKAAKEVSSFGEQVGELTSELQRIRKGMSKA